MVTRQEIVWTSREFTDGKTLIFLVGQQGVYDLESDTLNKIINDKIRQCEAVLEQWNILKNMREEALNAQASS